MRCFNAPKASAFDYNLLEPLQKLLRLSSPVAVSLARADLFSGISQKLNHKKAVVRLNLLRIVRSICDPSEDQAESIRRHKLFTEIRSLAENDNAVLVRNMASELVKISLGKEHESGSSGRTRQSLARRQSSFTHSSLQSIASTPLTPTHASRLSQTSAFIDGSVTPRRGPILAVPTNGNDSSLYRPRSRDGAVFANRGSAESILYRPQSRDGQVITRRTSAESTSSSSSVSKSRLPRTSMLRTSRSSISTPSIKDEPAPASASTRKENGVRLRAQSKSTASPTGTAPQSNSKRRTRPPSGDIKWS